MSDAPAAASAPTAARSVIAVELANVTFRYDRRPVLTGISMTIPRGKVVAIMGGSGCGKTTILRLIGGQLKPQSGRVIVDGKSMPDLDREELYQMRRRFGMLFQFGALFTDMSVYENVAFALREHTDLPEELIRDLVRELFLRHVELEANSTNVGPVVSVRHHRCALLLAARPRAERSTM